MKSEYWSFVLKDLQNKESASAKVKATCNIPSQWYTDTEKKGLFYKIDEIISSYKISTNSKS